MIKIYWTKKRTRIFFIKLISETVSLFFINRLTASTRLRQKTDVLTKRNHLFYCAGRLPWFLATGPQAVRHTCLPQALCCRWSRTVLHRKTTVSGRSGAGGSGQVFPASWHLIQWIETYLHKLQSSREASWNAIMQVRYKIPNQEWQRPCAWKCSDHFLGLALMELKRRSLVTRSIVWMVLLSEWQAWIT